MTFKKNDPRCSRCGFELAKLPAEHVVEAPKPDADKTRIDLTCPLCGGEMLVELAAIQVIPRWSEGKWRYARWKTSTVQPTGASVALPGGRFRFTFAGGLSTIEPQEVCYSRVPIFVDENGERVVPTLPVRREFFDCVDFERFDELMKAGKSSDVSGGEYQALVPLLGLENLQSIRRPTASCGNERVVKEINLKLWPNIDCLEWKHHLLSVSATGPTGEALFYPGPRIRVTARGKKKWSKPLDSVQRGGLALVGAMDERPTWVCVEFTEPGKATDDSAEASSGCLFRVASSTGKTSDIDWNIGLDFGTSNTCVAVKGSQEVSDYESPRILPAVEDGSWNLYLVKGGNEPSKCSGPDLWPRASGFGASRDLFASEIVFPRTRKDQAELIGGIEGWKYGIDFGLSAPGIDPTFKESEYTVSDFKWIESLASTSFGKVQPELQACYLTAVLMHAYVRGAIAARATARIPQVRYSYPLAFRKTDFDTLSASADRAREVLNAWTGLSWDIQPGANECDAAAANAGSPDANVRVYLDMGGGSTDIAIMMESANNTWETVYSTSVRYAGMDLLRGWEGVDRRTSCLSGEGTFDVLRRRVREAKHIREILGDTTLFAKQYEAVRKNRCAHFYGYLVEYVARLLAAGFLDQRFRFKDGATGELKFRDLQAVVFFLGNGWKFEALINEDFKSTIIKAISKRMNQLITQEKSEYGSAVLRQLKGLKIRIDTKDLKDVPHEKAGVAVGLLRDSEIKRSGRRSADWDKGSGATRGILGWTTRVNREKDVPWFAMYDGATGMIPPGEKSGGDGDQGSEFVIGDSEESSKAAGELSTPWYKELPNNPSLDWKDVTPRIPEEFQSPFELDKDLDQTRSELRRECQPQVGAHSWFQRGPYEVMLDKLFRPALRKIGA